MARKYATRITAFMLGALGFIGMLGPFGTDVYTPAFPAMTRDLHVTPAHIQVTLSMFTIGMAVGQFFLGSLSDRWGRKPFIVGGGALMTLTALVAALVTDANILIGLCLVMGVSAATGVVGGRAVVADLTDGERAIRPFTVLGMVVSLGPITGPVAGALLLALGGWRAIFFGLAIYAAVATVLVVVILPESLGPEKRHRGGLIGTFRAAGRVLKDRQYLAFAALIWFGFGSMFAYISSSSFVVQENLGLPPFAFALSFGINGIGVVITSFVTARLAHRVRPRRLIRMGVIFQLVAYTALWVLIVAHVVTPWVVFPAFFLIASSMGFIFGPATGMAMVHVRFASGTALALLGSIQFVAASLSSTLTGWVNPNSLVALAEVGSVAALLVLTALILGRERDPSRLSNAG